MFSIFWGASFCRAHAQERDAETHKTKEENASTRFILTHKLLFSLSFLVRYRRKTNSSFPPNANAKSGKVSEKNLESSIYEHYSCIEHRMALNVFFTFAPNVPLPFLGGGETHGPGTVIYELSYLEDI